MYSIKRIAVCSLFVLAASASLAHAAQVPDGANRDLGDPNEAATKLAAHGGSVAAQKLIRQFVIEWESGYLSNGMEDYYNALTRYFRANYNVDFLNDIINDDGDDDDDDDDADEDRLFYALARALNYITSKKQHASTATASASAGAVNVTQQISTVFSHVWSVQTGAGNASPTPSSGSNPGGGAASGTGGSKPEGPNMAAGEVAPLWGAWGQVYGAWVYQDDRGGVTGYDTDVSGVVVGLDRRFSENIVLGFNLSAGDTAVDMKDGSGHLSTDNFGLGMYASYATKSWFVDSMLMYNRNDTVSRRRTILTNVTRYARADYDADQYTLNFGGGYVFSLAGGWSLVPSLHLQYSYYDQESYREDGGGFTDLAVSDYDTDTINTNLKVKVSRVMKSRYGHLFIPELSLGWIHEFQDPEASTSYYYRMSNPTVFKGKGLDPADDSLTIGVGLNVIFNQKVSAFVNYDFEAKSDYHGHVLSTGLRVEF